MGKKNSGSKGETGTPMWAALNLHATLGNTVISLILAPETQRSSNLQGLLYFFRDPTFHCGGISPPWLIYSWVSFLLVIYIFEDTMNDVWVCYPEFFLSMPDLRIQKSC